MTELKCVYCKKIIVEELEHAGMEDQYYVQCPYCGKQAINPFYEEKNKRGENGSD